jgi:hypothetical protein
MLVVQARFSTFGRAMADKDREDEKKPSGSNDDGEERDEKSAAAKSAAAKSAAAKSESDAAEDDKSGDRASPAKEPDAASTSKASEDDEPAGEGPESDRPAPAAASASSKDAKPAEKKRARDEDDEDEDEEEEEEKPKKVAPAKAKPSKGSGSSKTSGSEAGRRAGRRPPPKGGSLGKSLMLFVILIGGLAFLFLFLGREDQSQSGPQVAPKWKVGQVVDIEVTVVPTDAKDLACASQTSVNGRSCEFETPQKARAETSTDDKKVFKPYTTTDRVQVIGAGLWGEPALAAGKLPATRFSVKCKYTVEGKLKGHAIRWNGEGPWYPQNGEWNAGSFSDCKIVQ